MNCCCRIENLSTVSTIATSTTAVTLTPDTALIPNNTDRVALRLLASPTGATNVAAAVILDGASVPIFDRYGNIVYGNQLSNGMTLYGYYGTNGTGGTAHFIVYKVARRCC